MTRKTYQQLTLDSEFTDAHIKEADQSGSGGHVVEVTLIRAGTSTNGNHYPDNTLQKIAPLFEGARAFADHQDPAKNGQPRSVRDLVGHYRNTRYELAPAGGRIRADFHLLPAQDWLWAIIQEAQSQPSICGLSIDALGECNTAEVGGRPVRVVETVRKVNSVDIVSKPAAGGSLDRILAAEQDQARCGHCWGTGRADAGSGPAPTSAANHCPHCHGTGAIDRILAAELADPKAPSNLSGTDQGDGISDERPVMEQTLSPEDHQKFATIVRHKPDGSTDYKFPIPPKGHPAAQSHAQNALARLNQSDLTDTEKATVRAKAHDILGTTQENDMPTTTAPSTTLNENVDPAASVKLTEQTQTAEAPPPDTTAMLKKLQLEHDQATRELAQIKEALAPAPASPDDPNASAVQLLEQIKRDRDTEKSARILDAKLAESALPDPIKARLRKRYDGRVFTEAQITEDIGEERDVLGSLSRSGQVSGNGYEKPLTLGMSEYEQLQAAFDNLFGVTESEAARSVPAISGIREAFRIATGTDIANIGGCDRPLQEAYATGLRNYVHAKMASGQLTEAEYLLRETDVTTSSFSFLLGTSMNKRLLKDYQAWPSEWQKFANVVAVKDFKTQDRIRLGAFGSLSTVNEDAAYTALTLADTHATYTPTKRGNLVQISRETIINDDLYAIKQIPQKLAVSAAFTLAEFVYQLLDPAAGNIYDSHKLFDTTNHGNTGVATANLGTANSGTALSSAALQTAVVAMRKQQNNASKPIGLKPRFLLVCPDLEFTAMVILKSAGLPGGANNDINPMMGYAEPIVSPQCNSFTNEGATTTFAAAIADPRVIDTIEVGFIGGQVNPVLFIQDQPLYGINFTQDVISYKVRHEYGGAVVDYRGFYLINN